MIIWYCFNFFESCDHLPKKKYSFLVRKKYQHFCHLSGIGLNTHSVSDLSFFWACFSFIGATSMEMLLFCAYLPVYIDGYHLTLKNVLKMRREYVNYFIVICVQCKSYWRHFRLKSVVCNSFKDDRLWNKDEVLCLTKQCHFVFMINVMHLVLRESLLDKIIVRITIFY